MSNSDMLCWDLTPLYAAVDDPALRRDLDAAKVEAAAFRADWRGRLAEPQLTAAELATALERYAALQLLALRPYLFAQLLFSGDGSDACHMRLLAEVRETWQGISEGLCFSNWNCCACRPRPSTGYAPLPNWFLTATT